MVDTKAICTQFTNEEIDRMLAIKHEHALIAAEMASEGWTDCSTPLFQRVRNVLAELQKLRAASNG